MSTSNLYIYASGLVEMYVSNPDETWYLPSILIQTYLNQWIFRAYTINFSSNTLTIESTIGTTTVTIQSLDGFAFYDSNSLMRIGQYSTYTWYNLKGFIYSFTV